MGGVSIIIPTKGRRTLAGALDSLTPQLHADDELIVVADGCQPYARNLTRAVMALTETRVLYTEVTVPGSLYGNGQRDVGLKFASRDHLLFLDDDDEYLPGALGLVRAAVETAPHAVHVFRAEWGAGHHAAGTILWREPVFAEQNIATPMVIIPRHDGLPLWMDSNDRGTLSDFGWLSGALGMKRVCWHEELIATVRPVAAAA